MSSPTARISRRTIGKVMIVIGIIGVIISITAVVIGQNLVRQVEHSVDDSLVITNRGLGAVTDSISATSTMVDTIRAGVSSVGETLGVLQTSIGETSSVITDTGTFLGGSLPDSLDAVAATLPTIESVASSIDTALNALSDIPFGPDYKPAKPFDETIAQLSTALAPLPGQLRTLSGDFTDLNTSTLAISTQLGALAGDVTQLGTQLTAISGLVDRYASTVADASQLATQSRRDLRTSANATRLLLVLLGIVFGLGQVVPIWLGTVLLGRGGDQTIIPRPPDGTQSVVASHKLLTAPPEHPPKMEA